MRKKKLFSNLLCVLLVCLLLSSALINVNGTTVELNDTKIDYGLQSLLEKANDNDKISVSVWLKDIDHNTVKQEVINLLKNKINNGIISKETIDNSFIDNGGSNINISNYLFLNKIQGNVSFEEISTVVSAVRKTYKNVLSEYNKKIFNNLICELDSDNPEIIMMSEYAPNIDLRLNKEQIYKLSELSCISQIYYLDENAKFIDDVNDDEEDEYDLPIDTPYFDVTGISNARDNLGLTGSCIKVGMIEAEYLPLTQYFPNSNLTNITGTVNQGKFHGTRVALVMVGNDDKYTGAIPDAELYCTIIGSVGYRERAIGELLSCGVTAINMSCSMIDEDYGYNSYGTLSRYIDYISCNYDVTFVMSSGNTQDIGVSSSNMSYNAIIVGNCDNSGKLEKDSSYIFDRDKSYKPDIVAPGVKIDTPGGQMTGTSASAPMVTSAIAQLTQAFPSIAGKSELIKSILMSSSTITEYMDLNDVITTTESKVNSISLSKKFGSGLLNVINAHNLVSNNNYISGIMHKGCPQICKSININNAAGKLLRFSLSWNKINTEDTSYPLDSIILEVISPNGQKYKSDYLFDNKQIVTFNATENGVYKVNIIKNYYSLSQNNTDYALSYYLQ